MRGVVTFLLCIICYTTAFRASPGCGRPVPISKGSLVTRSIDIKDKDFATDRTYITYVPQSYDVNTPLPLLMWYHGQYGSALSDGNRNLKFTDYDMISVYLQGLSEDGGCGTGWNVGWTGDKSACQSSGVSDGCCYSSCKSLGYCTGNGRSGNNCGWSTCYDDVQFTYDLLTSLGNELCIDLDAVFASGWSNGGMLVHWLATKLPTTFASFIPVYGLPLEGFTDVPNTLTGTSILSLHGRSDKVIPVEGGLAGGWYYESTDTIIGLWAKVHGCNNNPTTISTPYDGGSKNFQCQEYTQCSTSQRVLRCLYDGVHGSVIPDHEAISMWFFEQSMNSNRTFTDHTS